LFQCRMTSTEKSEKCFIWHLAFTVNQVQMGLPILAGLHSYPYFW
jgi:hypothetical protein